MIRRSQPVSALRRQLRELAVILLSPDILPLLLWMVMLYYGLVINMPYYEAMDDAAMRIFVSGYLPYSEPSGFSVFMSYFYGAAVAFFYRIWPEIAWYDWGFALLSSVGFWLYFRSLLTVQGACRYLALPMLALVTGLVFICVQFTIVSGFLAASALLAGISSIFSREEDAGWRRAAPVLLVVCGALASLVRFDSIVLMVAFAGAAGLPLLVSGYFRHRAQTRRVLAAMALLLAVAFGLRWADDAVYAHDPEWKDVRSLYGMMYPLQEYNPYFRQPYPELVEAFRRVGWSEADMTMYTNWFYSHPTFGYESHQEKFRPLYEAGRKVKWEQLQRLEWVKLVRTYFELYTPYGWCLLLLGLALGIRPLLFAGYLFAGLMGVSLLIEILMKPVPMRVHYGLFLLMLGLLMLAPAAFATGKPFRFPRLLWVWRIGFMAAFSWTMWQEFAHMGNSWRITSEHRRVALQNISDANAAYPTSRYKWVVRGDDFPFTSWLVPYRPVNRLNDFHLDFLLGGASQTPYVHSRLKAYGMESLEKALCTRDDVLFVSRRHDFLPAFMAQHYQMKVRLEVLFDSHGVTLTRCVPREDGTEAP